MTKVIILDGEENTFFDSVSCIPQKKFLPDDERQSLRVVLKDDSAVIIGHDMIHEEYGGHLSFVFDGIKYIVDDGYRNSLARAGYIVFQNYDNEKEYNYNNGQALNEKIFDDIREASAVIEKEISEDSSKFTSFSYRSAGSQYSAVLSDGIYKYTVDIVTNSDIVAKNRKRKINNLSFYPFEKNMDRYGTVYMAIYCEKIFSIVDEHVVPKYYKYNVCDDIVKLYINHLHEYHYDQMEITRHIVKYTDI
jgi:hypothetical protein